MTQIREDRMWLGAIALVAGLLACLVSSEAASAYRVVGVTDESPSRIASLSTFSPQSVSLSSVTFPEGTADEELVGLAYRPGTNDLYAVGGDGSVYVLTGAGPYVAIRVGAPPPVDPLPSPNAGVYFDPFTGLLRVRGGPDANLAFDPVTGQPAVSGEPPLLGEVPGEPSPNVIAAAYRDIGDVDSVYFAHRELMIDAASGSLATRGDRWTAIPQFEVGTPPLGDVGGLATKQRGDVTRNDAVAVLQRGVAPGSELCRIAIENVYVGKGLELEHEGLKECVPLGGGVPIRGIAIAPYSVVEVPDTKIVAAEGRELELTARLTGGLSGPLTVPWSAGTGHRNGGSLRFLSGSFSFSPGQAVSRSRVLLPQDHRVEPTRWFTAVLDWGADDLWAPADLRSARVSVVDDELRANWRRQHRRWTVRRAVGKRRLVLPFACSQDCGWRAVLRAGRQRLSISREAVGYDGEQQVVFHLRRRALRVLRRSGRAGIVLRARARFKAPFASDVAGRRFRLPSGRHGG